MRARVVAAIVGGGLFLLAWVAGVLVVSDHVVGAGTAAQFAYFAAAGSLWVLPITWLMLWAARSP